MLDNLYAAAFSKIIIDYNMLESTLYNEYNPNVYQNVNQNEQANNDFTKFMRKLITEMRKRERNVGMKISKNRKYYYTIILYILYYTILLCY